MFTVETITADAKQKQTLILQDGTSFTIQLEYKPMQYGWFIKSLAYQAFTVENIKVCTSPNLLHQYKNQIPFGICVVSKNNFEPTQQQDFLNKNSIMYILTSDEVNQYTEYLSANG